MSAHTPGPWGYGPTLLSGCYRVEASGHDEDGPCDVPVCDDVRGEANARLIAQAPRMLGVLQAVASFNERDHCPLSDDYVCALCETMRETRAILREIEGVS